MVQLSAMEAQCSKMFLDCIDWDSDNINYAELMKMYDMLYQLYCAKLTEEGQDLRREQNIRNWIKETHRARISGKSK